MIHFNFGGKKDSNVEKTLVQMLLFQFMTLSLSGISKTINKCYLIADKQIDEHRKNCTFSSLEIELMIWPIANNRLKAEYLELEGIGDIWFFYRRCFELFLRYLNLLPKAKNNCYRIIFKCILFASENSHARIPTFSGFNCKSYRHLSEANALLEFLSYFDNNPRAKTYAIRLLKCDCRVHKNGCMTYLMENIDGLIDKLNNSLDDDY